MLTKKTGQAWSKSDVALVAEYLGIKATNNEYHYGHTHGKTQLHQYSDRFIEFAAQRLGQNPSLLHDARNAKSKKAPPKPARGK